MGNEGRRFVCGSEVEDFRKASASVVRRCVVVTAAVVGGAVVMTSLGGCYQKVVGARGLGADQYTIEQPDYEGNSWIDRNIFGVSPSRTDRRGSRLQ